MLNKRGTAVQWAFLSGIDVYICAYNLDTGGYNLDKSAYNLDKGAYNLTDSWAVLTVVHSSPSFSDIPRTLPDCNLKLP